MAQVPFTDLSASKIRPILVLADEGQDVLFLPLTTNLSQPGVKITSSDLEKGSLKKDSVIVVHKVCLLHKSLLLRKLAKLKEGSFKKVKNSLCRKLSCLSGHTQAG